MGLSIVLKAELPNRGFLSRIRNKPTDWHFEVQRALVETTVSLGMHEFLPHSSSRSPGRVAAHYSEEWLDLTVDEKEFEIAGRVSTCGPGYFAMICGLADKLTETHGLRFRDEGDDVSNYFEKRDFSLLQESYCYWLRALCKAVASNRTGKNYQTVQLPIGQLVPDERGAEVYSPRGHRTKAQLGAISKLNDDKLREAAKEWFPWWNERANGHDFYKIAEQLMWCDVTWNTPEDEHSKHVLNATLAALAKAKALGFGTESLSSERNELVDLLNRDEDMEVPPSKLGIGYRRGPCRWKLTPTWSAVLPGYMREIVEEDSYQIYFGDLVIFVSGYTIGGEHHTYDLPEFSEGSLMLGHGKGNDCHWLLERPEIGPTSEFTHSNLTAKAKGGMLLMTFTHTEKTTDAELLEIAKSLSFNKNE